jgi:muramoyltetrapeptide carboxypeptidase
MAIKPFKLNKGDTIGVIAPASPMKIKALKAGVSYLQKLGYKVIVGKSVFKKRGYFAGSDKDRLNDINYMIENSEVKAIICARGGWGTLRILDKINYEILKQNPKIISGYSDITSLQIAIYTKSNILTFSGAMVASDMSDFDPFTEKVFWNIVTEVHDNIILKNPNNKKLKAIKPGVAEGELIGGCLSLVVSILGTPFQPDFKGKILFLEDIGEPPYKIDRMLTQLKRAGVLQSVSGIVFGEFVDCKPKEKSKSLTLEQVIQDTVRDLNIPVFKGLVYGHINKRVTMPIGARARVDSRKGFIEIMENVIQ